MVDSYRAFFAASVGASAAFIGLLFVAVSFIDAAKVDETTRNWRRIIANSSFSQLANVFFVSLGGLLPDPHSLAIIGVVMGALGLLVAMKLLPQTIRQEHSGRRTPTILGLAATAAYALEAVTGAELLSNPNNPQLLSYFILAMILLYAGALARAWEITGVKQRP